MQFSAQVEQRGSSVKALRAEFQQIIVATFAANHTAGGGAGFDNLCVDARLAQRVSAHQSGYSRADNQSWDLTSHGNEERMEVDATEFLKITVGRSSAAFRDTDRKASQDCG